ncbi:hypothetical protein CORC01_00551 [Colletotrichum orchidophilum]|uniref:Uncharacterized protein n=1 Tax=Colletotrichum orchidophilum TaxID=1209926 RepID=A0A1G4BRZ3_9PEZI|nr:uncharacterized protein CORC01_00551 [Colletotrichum orchidophilum]OHF04212.1 hypothetical protein CORC01_00551 [Colletotrichum orchidophilum]
MPSSLIHIVFPFITLAGLYAVSNLMINSGHAQLFTDSRAPATPLLPDNKTPLLTFYTGVPPLDSYLANLQFSIIPTVDGSSPGLSLLGWHWVGLLLAVFAVMLVESLRTRRTRDLIPFVLWGLAIQYAGYFIVMPLYCYVSLLFRAPGSQAKIPTMAAIQAVPASLLIGLVIPSAIMCLPGTYHTGQSRQVSVAVWQNFPAWMALVQVIAMTLIDHRWAQRREECKVKDEEPSSHTSALRRLYQATATVSASMHVLGLVPIILAASGKLEPTETSPHPQWQPVIFFLPQRWDSKMQINGMAEGAFNFLRFCWLSAWKKMSILRRKVTRFAPPAVLTDKVIPVDYWDHHSRDAVLNVMLRFDRQLDAAKLRRALEVLLDRRDGWRRLGARVRLGPSNKLYWHVPATFTEQRPAITYHHNRHNNISIRQHPLASRLQSRSKDGARPASFSPSPSAPTHSTHDSGPWIVEPGSGVDFSPLMRHPSDPTCFEDYLYHDQPMIGLQVTTFNDATLVSLGFSHIMWDCMGLKDLLDAWSLTLQGRQNEVIPLIDTDPLGSLGVSTELLQTKPRDDEEKATVPSSAPEEYKHVKAQLGVVQLVTLGLRQALDKLLNKSAAEEFRTVCVPAAYVKTLRKDALKALEAGNINAPSVQVSDKDNESRVAPKTTFLSDGDILCSWWTRNIIASRIRNPTRSRKTIAILNMMGLRGVLAQAGCLQGRGALVGNAILPVPTLLRARDLVSKGPLGLGRVAKALREAIVQLSTRPQVEALLALQRRAHGNESNEDVENKKKKGNGKAGLPALFGNAGMHMVVCTNWTKAEFFNVDFSAAVVDEIGCDGLFENERVPLSETPSEDAGGASNGAERKSAMGCDGLWEDEHELRSSASLRADVPAAPRVVAKPTGVHMHLITAGTPAFLMSIFTILGRDANGDYWIQGMLRKKYWAKIENSLSQEQAPLRGAAKSKQSNIAEIDVGRQPSPHS